MSILMGSFQTFSYSSSRLSLQRSALLGATPDHQGPRSNPLLVSASPDNMHAPLFHRAAIGGYDIVVLDILLTNMPFFDDMA